MFGCHSERAARLQKENFTYSLFGDLSHKMAIVLEVHPGDISVISTHTKKVKKRQHFLDKRNQGSIYNVVSRCFMSLLL